MTQLDRHRLSQQKPVETKPLSEQQAKTHKLDVKFYKKATEVDSILIATSGKVSDYALAETAYLFGKMMKSICLLYTSPSPRD